MAEALWDQPGGIHGLLDVLDEHGEAIEHDLVCAGWTLDDIGGRLPWTAVRSFIHQDAQQRGTALHRELAGDDHIWGLPEQLLATIVDAVQVGNWQRASGGKRKPKKPKPVPRPGVGPRKVGGSTTVSLAEARRIFARRNPAAFEAWEPPPTCDVDGCERTDVHARGMCGMHYQRWRRHGDPTVTAG